LDPPLVTTTAILPPSLGLSYKAEDILQEAFARAIGAPNVFRGTDHVIRWMYTVIRNRITDRHRHNSRWRALVSGLSFDGSLEDVLADWRVDVAERLDRRIAEECLARCIQRLPTPQRQVFVLTELEGRSFSEIEGRFPGVPRNTLIWRRHAAIRRLRKWLTEMLL